MNGPKSIGEVTASTFDIASKLSKSIKETNKAMRLKYDILTEDFLVNIAKSGTKLLHLSSDIIASEYLCVEGENGVCEKIHENRLFDLLEQNCEDPRTGEKKLKIDVVSLAIPDSDGIGKKFI